MKEKIKEIREILSDKKFYLITNERTLKKIYDFLDQAVLIIQDLAKTSKSNFFEITISICGIFVAKLAELEKDILAGRVNYQTIRTLTWGDKSIQIGVQDLFLMMLKQIEVALTSTKKQLKIHKKKQNEIISEYKANDPNFLDPVKYSHDLFKIIFTTITKKFPKFTLDWLLEWDISIRKPVNECMTILITKGTLKYKEDAQTWVKKINALPGFWNSATYKEKANGYALMIRRAEILCEKLKILQKKEKLWNKTLAKGNKSSLGYLEYKDLITFAKVSNKALAIAEKGLKIVEDSYAKLPQPRT